VGMAEHGVLVYFPGRAGEGRGGGGLYFTSFFCLLSLGSQKEGGGGEALAFVYLSVFPARRPPRLTCLALKPTRLLVGSSYPSYWDAYGQWVFLKNKKCCGFGVAPPLPWVPYVYYHFLHFFLTRLCSSHALVFSLSATATLPSSVVTFVQTVLLLDGLLSHLSCVPYLLPPQSSTPPSSL